MHVVRVRGPVTVGKQQNEMGEPTMKWTPNMGPMIKAVLSELGVKTTPRITTGHTLEDTKWLDMIFARDAVTLLAQNEYAPSSDGILVIDMSKINFL